MATYKITIEMSDGRQGYYNFEAEDYADAVIQMGTKRVQELTPTPGIDRVLSMNSTDESPTESLVVIEN